MTRYIAIAEATAVAAALGFTVRDMGLLSSALARPAAGMFGTDAYAMLELKAAALFSSLGRNHALFDGNKRFSWIITLTFLELNGVRIDTPDDDAFALVMANARGEASLEDAAGAFGRWSTPARRGST